MGKLNVWSRQIKQDIETKSEELYRKDFKFFKLDRLENISEHVDGFSDNCKICYENKNEIEDIVDKLHDYLKGSISGRAKYERRTEKIVKHLKKEHKLMPKEYFAASYSLFGLVAGMIAGAGISYLISPDYLKLGIIIGFATGISVGRILGKIKDKQNKKAGLIL